METPEIKDRYVFLMYAWEIPRENEYLPEVT